VYPKTRSLKIRAYSVPICIRRGHVFFAFVCVSVFPQDNTKSYEFWMIFWTGHGICH